MSVEHCVVPGDYFVSKFPTMYVVIVLYIVFEGILKRFLYEVNK